MKIILAYVFYHIGDKTWNIMDTGILPDWLFDTIVNTFESIQPIGREKLFNYFVKHKLKNLMEHINEF